MSGIGVAQRTGLLHHSLLVGGQGGVDRDQVLERASGLDAAVDLVGLVGEGAHMGAHDGLGDGAVLGPLEQEILGADEPHALDVDHGVPTCRDMKWCTDNKKV